MGPTRKTTVLKFSMILSEFVKRAGGGSVDNVGQWTALPMSCYLIARIVTRQHTFPTDSNLWRLLASVSLSQMAVQSSYVSTVTSVSKRMVPIICVAGGISSTSQQSLLHTVLNSFVNGHQSHRSKFSVTVSSGNMLRFCPLQKICFYTNAGNC